MEAAVAVEVAAAVDQTQLKILKIKTKQNNKKLQRIQRMVQPKKLKQNRKKFHTMKKKKKNKLSMQKKSLN